MLTLGPEMTPAEIAAEAAYGGEEDDEATGLFMLPPPHPSVLLGEDTEIGLNYEGMQPRNNNHNNANNHQNPQGNAALAAAGVAAAAAAAAGPAVGQPPIAHPWVMGPGQPLAAQQHQHQHQQQQQAGAPAAAAMAGPAGAGVGEAAAAAVPPRRQPPADPLQHHYYSHYYTYQNSRMRAPRRRRHVICTLIDLGACVRRVLGVLHA